MFKGFCIAHMSRMNTGALHRCPVCPLAHRLTRTGNTEADPGLTASASATSSPSSPANSPQRASSGSSNSGGFASPPASPSHHGSGSAESKDSKDKPAADDKDNDKALMSALFGRDNDPKPFSVTKVSSLLVCLRRQCAMCT